MAKRPGDETTGWFCWVDTDEETVREIESPDGAPRPRTVSARSPLVAAVRAAADELDDSEFDAEPLFVRVLERGGEGLHLVRLDHDDERLRARDIEDGDDGGDDEDDE